MSTLVATRNVKVIPSSGGAPKTISTSATTYGELQSELYDNGFDYKNSNAIEGTTQTQLVTSDSVLPTGDFTLFLVGKQKVKSGAISKDSALRAISTIRDYLGALEEYINTERVAQTSASISEEEQALLDKFTRDLNGGYSSDEDYDENEDYDDEDEDY